MGVREPCIRISILPLTTCGLDLQSLSLSPFISMMRLIVLNRPVIPNTHDYGGYNEETFAKEPSVMPDAQ